MQTILPYVGNHYMKFCLPACLPAGKVQKMNGGVRRKESKGDRRKYKRNAVVLW